MSQSLFPELDPPLPSTAGGRTLLDEPPADAPLSDRMRPRTLAEFEGQGEVVGPGTALRRAIESDAVHSLILWGPPGSGKTTLAAIIARQTRARFVPFSAVVSGIREIRELMAESSAHRRATGKRTILFIDEIHRFNRAQQDAFLPFVERGDIVLVGATTENPSFEVNAALLSRSKVYVLRRLEEAEIVHLLARALASEHGLRGRVDAAAAIVEEIARRSQGDARFALNTLEIAAAAAPEGPEGRRTITPATLADALQRTALYHDKAGEEHFNLISALHKSMRASDPDAAIYYLARMLEGGEDPLYVARRIVRFASEDIGNADPRALMVAVAAKEAVYFIGLPEGALALAQAAVYCAAAPKSDRVYRAYGEAVAAIRSGTTDPVPLHLRNAPTGLMSNLGYGKGYEHAHDYEDAVAGMECLPESLRGRRFYLPSDAGYEKTIRLFLEHREALRRRGPRRAEPPPGRGE